MSLQQKAERIDSWRKWGRGKIRRVRTPEGARFYGAPIGTPIVADKATGKLRALTTAKLPQAPLLKDWKPGDPTDRIKAQITDVVRGVLDEAGLPEGTLTVSVKPASTLSKLTVAVRYSRPDDYKKASVALHRQIYPSERKVHNWQFSMAKDLQGHGIGAKMTAALEDLWRSEGIETVTVGANADVGGYAWARLGFEFKDPAQAAEFVSDAQKQITKYAPIWAKKVSPEYVEDVKAQVQALQERLDAGDTILPAEIAMLGYREGLDDPPFYWLGKRVLLGTSWDGVKDIYQPVVMQQRTRKKATNPGAPEGGEWIFEDGAAVEFVAPHEELVAGGLRSWVGSPADMHIHMADEIAGAPQPSSGGGKIMRAEAKALLEELARNGKSTPKLYRGATNTSLDEIPQSWSENRATARRFAKLSGGTVDTLQPGEAVGIRMADYITSGLDEFEQQWLVVAPKVLAQRTRKNTPLQTFLAEAGYTDWETTKPWERSWDDVVNNRVPGIRYDPELSANAMWRADHFVFGPQAKDLYFGSEDRTATRAVMYHEVGHAIQTDIRDTAILEPFRVASQSVRGYGRNNWRSPFSGDVDGPMHDADRPGEILADAYAALATGSAWMYAGIPGVTALYERVNEAAARLGLPTYTWERPEIESHEDWRKSNGVYRRRPAGGFLAEVRRRDDTASGWQWATSAPGEEYVTGGTAKTLKEARSAADKAVERFRGMLGEQKPQVLAQRTKRNAPPKGSGAEILSRVVLPEGTALALSREDEVKSKIAGVQKVKDTLTDIDVGLRTGVRARIEQAVGDYFAYARQIGINNPMLSPAEVFARADVQALWAQEAASLHSWLANRISEGFYKGADLGRSGDAHGVLDEGYLDAVNQDLTNYLATLDSQVRSAVWNAYNQIDWVPSYAQGGTSTNVPHDTAVKRWDTASDSQSAVVTDISRRAHAGISAATHRGYTEGQLSTITDTSMLKMWVANFAQPPERGPCLTCIALHGMTIPVTEQFPAEVTYAAKPLGVYRDLLGPPRHPHCFPADTLVSAPDVELGYVRYYEGPMVRVTTESGQILSATPNHPVLTSSRGWQPIGSLTPRDDLCRYLGDDVDGGSDVQDVPARIADVVMTLAERGHTVTEGSAGDFHGDGSDGEVHVVGADSTLLGEGDVGIAQCGHEVRLVTGDVGEALLVDQSPTPFLGVAHGGGTASMVGSRRDALALLEGESGHASRRPFAAVADLDPVVGEPTVDDVPGNLVAQAEFLLGSPGKVVFDRVVEVVWDRDWAGHVYNLQTARGWYAANTYVSANCKCKLVFFAAHEDPGPVSKKMNEYAMDVVTSTMATTGFTAKQVRALPEPLFERLWRFLMRGGWWKRLWKRLRSG